MPSIESLRQTEYAQLDQQRHVYLDHAGSALPPSSLVRAHTDLLLSSVLGNPHSSNPTSHLSTTLVARTRAHILSFFNCDPLKHSVILTPNASAAAKLVAEAFPFRRDAALVLLADNHNSLLGARQYAARARARVSYVPLDRHLRAVPHAEAVLRAAAVRGRAARARARTAAPALFAYPLQSNFSGVKHSPHLAAAAKRLGFFVLVDAAAAAPTCRVDVGALQADFVCVSFYKMTGFPTGIGALIARNDALRMLRRPWFAGGTVVFSSVAADIHRLQDGAEAFEDGTLNFQMIPAVDRGLTFLESLGMHKIEQHVRRLTERMLHGLLKLRHENGRRAIRIYGPEDVVDRGATVNFNVLDADGDVVDSAVVEREANRRGISIRTGCFCNPGAAERAFGVDERRQSACAGKLGAAVSPVAVAECLGLAYMSSVRASLGVANDEKDVDALVAFLDELVRGTGVTGGGEKRRRREVAAAREEKEKGRAASWSGRGFLRSMRERIRPPIPVEPYQEVRRELHGQSENGIN